VITSLLVANRGEIARRVFRTCRTLGIGTVAVLSDADAAAPHVGEADAAVLLPGSAPADTYLRADLLVAAARTGRVVNIKKGQFLAPADMRHAVAKIAAAGNTSILVTERGVSFGYNNLVVDMRAFPMLRALGYPVVFDVTHSLQLPGAGDGVTIGLAEYIEPMASAGVAAGVDAVFMEVHEDPARARSDAANALSLDKLEALLRKLTRIDAAARGEAAAR